MTSSSFLSSPDEDDQPGGLVICRPPKIKGLFASWLFQSDIHVGSSATDYDMIEEELKQAKELNARILINGDLFENLFPQNTKMYQPHAVHRRIRGSSDQVNRAIEWAVEIYGPYAHLIDMVGMGNHEGSHRTGPVDMVAMFVKEMNRLSGDHVVHYGGYTGFVDYSFTFSPSRRFVIYYHHGWGSGSSLASSVSDFNRTHHVERADVVWLGHKHCKLSAEIVRPSCPKKGYQTKIRTVRLIRTGAYMDSFKAQTQASLFNEGRKGNYAADAGLLMGHGKGGAWLNLTLSPKYKLTVTH